MYVPYTGIYEINILKADVTVGYLYNLTLVIPNATDTVGRPNSIIPVEYILLPFSSNNRPYCGGLTVDVANSHTEELIWILTISLGMTNIIERMGIIQNNNKEMH